MTTQANMNLVDKPSDKDFILPTLPPPPSDDFLLKQQKTSENKDNQFGISYKVSHKATAVWQPTSPTSPNNTEFPPPPDDLPSAPQSPRWPHNHRIREAVRDDGEVEGIPKRVTSCSQETDERSRDKGGKFDESFDPWNSLSCSPWC
uniref:Uncharacterized protein n=1 Tax=Ciona savignyi TaxID=51511 RepID=H2Z3U2_CIOSA